MAKGTRISTVAEPRWLIAPALLFILAFFVAPLGFMVAFSLGVNEGFFTVAFGFHTDQFERLADPIYLRIYRDTFVLALLGTLACLLLGYPFAYFLATRAGRFKSLLFVLVIVPFWTSLLIRTYSWVLILNEQGPLSRSLQRVGLIDGPLDILYTQAAVLIGVVYDYLPLMVFPLYVADRAPGQVSARGQPRPGLRPLGDLPSGDVAVDDPGHPHRLPAHVHPDDGGVRRADHSGRSQDLPRRKPRARTRSSRPSTGRSVRPSRWG